MQDPGSVPRSTRAVARWRGLRDAYAADWVATGSRAARNAALEAHHMSELHAAARDLEVAGDPPERTPAP